METIHRKQFQIAPIHLDCFGRVKPSALLHFIQEAAGAHCIELALDWDTLAKRNLFWAVIRNRLQILQLPTAGETVTVETWPMPTTRSAFPRAAVGYDSQGNELFRSVSLWVLMDTRTRSMVLPGKSGIDLAGTLRGNELAAPGSLHPLECDNSSCRKVCYSDLDRNGHMNNTRYMDWIDDLLPAAFHAGHPAKELTLCYLSEAREGEEMDMHWVLTDDTCLQVDARRRQTDDLGKQTRIFSAQVLF